MFVVKLKYKEDKEIKYANKSVIQERKEARNNVDWFRMKLEDASKLMTELINRNSESSNYGWGGFVDQKKLDYISIVELSTYAPYSEYEVRDFMEFT